MKDFLRVSPEAADALAGGRPVVAFESTIISHGMPHPLNIETALGAERIAREMGVVPATVGVLDGRIVVGLGRSEIKLLATEKGVLKVSRRDISWSLARGLPGATTVCATMFAAHLAGIGVFATGGIGGVHRGAAGGGLRGATFDVSADLGELGRTPVCVVSAGAKAVLDLPATLEVLETAGVPVVGFRTREFPAFWSRSSGLPLGLTVESAVEVARMIVVHRSLGLPQGILVANPVPAEHEIPRAELEPHVQQAVLELESRRISGKEVTPFLLGRIGELTGGRALETNVHLFHHNVRLACEIATELAKLWKDQG
ncbi:MAG: pseudouridine-5-phosphate glycosidase [Spirochaetes bacterium RBG_13_68_11]|nr:MAG: pseudouridine-5-phosphate glycosidase [Spirochaetes bacterium RBG_13_68_11]